MIGADGLHAHRPRVSVCVGVHMCHVAAFGAMGTDIWWRSHARKDGQSKSRGAKMETTGRWRDTSAEFISCEMFPVGRDAPPSCSTHRRAHGKCHMTFCHPVRRRASSGFPGRQMFLSSSRDGRHSTSHTEVLILVQFLWSFSVKRLFMESGGSEEISQRGSFTLCPWSFSGQTVETPRVLRNYRDNPDI